jgi:hypothetical protein
MTKSKPKILAIQPLCTWVTEEETEGERERD